MGTSQLVDNATGPKDTRAQVERVSHEELDKRYAASPTALRLKCTEIQVETIKHDSVLSKYFFHKLNPLLILKPILTPSL